MKQTRISRRTVLVGACQIPVVTLTFLAGCVPKQATSRCVDPDQLSAGESSLRASVKYTDSAPDPAQACGGCAYFRASAETAQCGECEILNGVVDVKGHCQSWSAKT